MEGGGRVLLNSNAALDPGATPQYGFNMRAIDSENSTTLFNMTINVFYDPSTIEFEPYNDTCIEEELG